MTHPTDLREPLVQMMRAALRAVDPAAAVRRAVVLEGDTLTVGTVAYSPVRDRAYSGRRRGEGGRAHVRGAA